MKILVSVYIWTVGIITFILMLITGLILSYIFPLEKYDPWFKKMMRLLFKITGIKVRVDGDTRFEKNKSYLFMSNHVSLFDLPLLSGFIPLTFYGVASEHQFRWPLYGWFMQRYASIPINRNSIHGSIAAIRQAAELLRTGKSVAILPEGYRTLDGKLGPFKKLPFHLAKKAEVDIIPVGLSGLFSLKNKGSWLVQRQQIQIKFGNRIPAKEIKNLSTQQLMALTRKRINELIDWV